MGLMPYFGTNTQLATIGLWEESEREVGQEHHALPSSDWVSGSKKHIQ